MFDGKTIENLIGSVEKAESHAKEVTAEQEVAEEMNRYELDALVALEFQPRTIAQLSVEVWEPILVCFHTTQRLRQKGLIEEGQGREWSLTAEGRRELQKALPLQDVPCVRLPEIGNA